MRPFFRRQQDLRGVDSESGNVTYQGEQNDEKCHHAKSKHRLGEFDFSAIDFYDTSEKTTDFKHPITSDHCPAGSLWSMYLQRASKIDDAFVESCREDMESLLLFAAIFSAAVTAFVVESYKQLQENSMGVAASLLRVIATQLSPDHDSATLIPTPRFRPSKLAIIFNTCWFLSLVFSLACALGAILVRQWVMKYSQNTREELIPHRRARMRQYLSEGVEHWKLMVFVELLPALLHFSLLLFALGLVAFLFDANVFVALVVSAVVAMVVLVYVGITLVPLFRPACPYQTPLSGPCVAVCSILDTVLYPAKRNCGDVKSAYGIDHKQSSVFGESSEQEGIDARAMGWLLASLTEGRECYEFLHAIPGFIALFQPRHQDVTGYSSILDIGVGTLLAQILESCLSLNRLQPARRGMVVACMDAILSIAQTTTPNREGLVEWRTWFGDSHWRILQRLREEENPDIAVRAMCITTIIATQRLNESRGTSHKKCSIARCRKDFETGQVSQGTQASHIRRLNLADRLWRECFLGASDISLGLLPPTGDFSSCLFHHLSLERKTELMNEHAITAKTSDERIIRHLKSTIFRYKFDFFFVFLHFVLDLRKMTTLSRESEQRALLAMKGVSRSIAATFPASDCANAGRFTWFFEQLQLHLPLRDISPPIRAIVVQGLATAIIPCHDQVQRLFENEMLADRKPALISASGTWSEKLNKALNALLAVTVQSKYPSDLILELLQTTANLATIDAVNISPSLLNTITYTHTGVSGPRIVSEWLRRSLQSVQPEESMRTPLLVCLGVILSRNQEPRNQIKSAEWLDCLGPTERSALRRLRQNADPDIAVQAACAIAYLATRQFDMRRSKVQKNDVSEATRPRAISGLNGVSMREELSSRLLFARRTWRECCFNDEDPLFGVASSYPPPYSTRDESNPTGKDLKDMSEGDLMVQLESIVLAFQHDYLIVLVRLLATVRNIDLVSESTSRIVVQTIDRIMHSVTNFLPLTDPANAPQFAWVLQQIDPTLSIWVSTSFGQSQSQIFTLYLDSKARFGQTSWVVDLVTLSMMQVVVPVLDDDSLDQCHVFLDRLADSAASTKHGTCASTTSEQVLMKTMEVLETFKVSADLLMESTAVTTMV